MSLNSGPSKKYKVGMNHSRSKLDANSELLENQEFRVAIYFETANTKRIKRTNNFKDFAEETLESIDD